MEKGTLSTYVAHFFLPPGTLPSCPPSTLRYIRWAPRWDGQSGVSYQLFITGSSPIMHANFVRVPAARALPC